MTTAKKAAIIQDGEDERPQGTTLEPEKAGPGWRQQLHLAPGDCIELLLARTWDGHGPLEEGQASCAA